MVGPQSPRPARALICRMAPNLCHYPFDTYSSAHTVTLQRFHLDPDHVLHLIRKFAFHVHNKNGHFSPIVPPAPDFANGVLNHSANHDTELKILGRAKLRRAKSGEAVLKAVLVGTSRENAKKLGSANSWNG